MPYAYFQEREDTKGYMLMLKGIILKQDIPLALYHDRYSVFEVTRNTEAGLEEQLAGSRFYVVQGFVVPAETLNKAVTINFNTKMPTTTWVKLLLCLTPIPSNR